MYFLGGKKCVSVQNLFFVFANILKDQPMASKTQSPSTSLELVKTWVAEHKFLLHRNACVNLHYGH